jgi:hypothetical protein
MNTLIFYFCIQYRMIPASYCIVLWSSMMQVWPSAASLTFDTLNCWLDYILITLWSHWQPEEISNLTTVFTDSSDDLVCHSIFSWNISLLTCLLNRRLSCWVVDFLTEL